MPKICPICGPNLSLFCMIISASGILFLGILGVFFYINSSILFEDMLKANALGEHWTFTTADTEFKQRAHNCWVAAGLYAVTLIASFWQNKWNSSASTNA